ARAVCDSYGLSGRLTALINSQELTLIPMVNPDGAVANVRTNANGVDLNRDFGYMWDAWGGSPDWCSQPETRALRDDCARQDYCLSLSYHSGAVCIIYPWMYTPVPTADDRLYKRLVWAYHSATGYDTIRSYRWYQTRGQSMDDRYGLDGTIEITAELHEFNPPPESINHRCRANYEATLYFLEKAATGIHGRVLDAVTGEPLHALVRLGPLWGGRDWFVYSAQANGDFHRPLLAGDYTLSAWAPGYAETTLDVRLPDTVTPVAVELRLRPANSAAAFRVVSVQQNDTVGRIAPSLTHWVLGQPDARAWSMSRRGRLILDMSRPVVDAPGPDLAVFEYPDTTDTVLVSGARNWTGPWTTLGLAVGTCSLDLAGRGIDSFRYILVRDVSRRPNSGAYDGYDLDAVVNLNPPAAIAANPTPGASRIPPVASIVRGSLNLTSGISHLTSDVALLDASGRRVLSLRPGPNDLSSLPPGVYFIPAASGLLRVVKPR
ncbi:MAG: M14 family zinc carboxypeptidase, partial [bacterium]